jgi:hypothetical protein
MYKTFDWKEKQGTRKITINKETEEKVHTDAMGLRNAKYDAQEELAVDALGEPPQP